MSKAVCSLLPESIRNSFRECGIAADGEKVPENELNERLKQLLVAPESAGMVLDIENASAENFTEMESHESDDELDYILKVRVTSPRAWMPISMKTAINTKTFEH